MRDYWKQMDQRMFDFQAFYMWAARLMPRTPVLAEVGVANGASAVFMAETLLNMGKLPTFYWIDSLGYGGPRQLSEILRHVGKAGLHGAVDILPLDSLNAACMFPDYHFDFVFIDASHRYELTKGDIRLWWPKIKERGWLAGHDYNENDGREVKQAVDELIPETVTRTDIPDRVFDPEPVLDVRTTDSGHGVWCVQRKFYVKINAL